MYNSDYIKLMEEQYTDNVKNYAQVNVDIMCDSSLFVLYFIYPFIERTLVEIMELSGSVNTENKEKITKRTINSIIDECHDNGLINTENKEILDRHFGKNGIRDQLFHLSDYNPTISLETIIEAKEITLVLLKLYNFLCNRINNFEVSYIENV